LVNVITEELGKPPAPYSRDVREAMRLTASLLHFVDLSASQRGKLIVSLAAHLEPLLGGTSEESRWETCDLTKLLFELSPDSPLRARAAAQLENLFNPNSSGFHSWVYTCFRTFHADERVLSSSVTASLQAYVKAALDADQNVLWAHPYLAAIIVSADPQFAVGGSVEETLRGLARRDPGCLREAHASNPVRVADFLFQGLKGEKRAEMLRAMPGIVEMLARNAAPPAFLAETLRSLTIVGDDDERRLGFRALGQLAASPHVGVEEKRSLGALAVERGLDDPEWRVQVSAIRVIGEAAKQGFFAIGVPAKLQDLAANADVALVRWVATIAAKHTHQN
jgi:hypothetical protein